MRALIIFSTILQTACGGMGLKATVFDESISSETGIEPGSEPDQTEDDPDMDGDGSPASVDCSDYDPFTYPGSAEKDSATACMTDFDNDGWGDSQPFSGGIEAGSDCDDSDSAIRPDASDIPNDGIDQNCDGLDAQSGGGGNGVDGDGDGFDMTVDCDDNNPRAFPGAAPNDSSWDCMVDADYDGFGDSSPAVWAISPGSDCDDSDSGVYPGSIDTPNDGIDQDCDGTDAGSGGGSGGNAVDSDNDGYDSSVDCDDNNDRTYPGAAYMDSFTDCMADVDYDGYGDDMPLVFGVMAGTDCDDYDASIRPGAYDTPNDGIDQDCDGSDAGSGGGGSVDADGDGYDSSVDCDDNDGRAYPGVAFFDSSTACMVDADYDGYGDAVPMTWTVSAGSDCDDSNYSINPSAYDTPNDGIDQDCDGSDAGSGGGGSVDADGDGYDSSVDCDDNDWQAYPGAAYYDSNTACMLDSDYDGFGDDNPSNWNVASGSDCDDSNYSINPNAYDTPNDGIDQDCNGSDAGSGGSGSVDNDFDGYDSSVDCDDTNYYVNPGMLEIWSNGVDDDCDGTIDFSLQTGTYGFNTPTELYNTCLGVSGGSVGFDADLGQIQGGVSLTYDNGSTLSLMYDGFGFASGVYSGQWDLSASGYDALISLTGETDISELSSTEVNLYEDYSFSSTCSGTDCATVISALGTPCTLSIMAYGVLGGSSGGGSSNSCCYTLTMSDSFGDGWNGASMDHYQNGILLQSSTLLSGSSGTDSICLNHGSSYSMDFTSGSWDSEISYTLSDHNGFTLSSGSWPSVGNLYSDLVSCQ